MHFLTPLTVLSLFLALMSPAVHASDLAASGGYLSVSEQRSALVACKYDRRIGGWPKFKATYVEKPSGGQTFLRILPHGNVTPAVAAEINACADRKLGRPTQPVTTPRAERKLGRCPAHAPVLYGGTTYCIGS